MADITSISAALTSLKSAIDIATFFKNSDVTFEKAEHKLKVAELLGSLADLKIQLAEVQQTILDKGSEIRKLETALTVKDNLVFERPYYWLEEADRRDGPFCQQCYDSDKRLIRLQTNGRGHWKCKTCDNAFQDSTYRPPAPMALETDFPFRR